MSDLIIRQDAIQALALLLSPVDVKTENQWIPVVMPKNGVKIIIQTKSGHIRIDECYWEGGHGIFLDSGFEWGTDIAAWMPLPEPYKGE